MLFRGSRCKASAMRKDNTREKEVDCIGRQLIVLWEVWKPQKHESPTTHKNIISFIVSKWNQTGVISGRLTAKFPSTKLFSRFSISFSFILLLVIFRSLRRGCSHWDDGYAAFLCLLRSFCESMLLIAASQQWFVLLVMQNRITCFFGMIAESIFLIRNPSTMSTRLPLSKFAPTNTTIHVHSCHTFRVYVVTWDGNLIFGVNLGHNGRTSWFPSNVGFRQNLGKRCQIPLNEHRASNVAPARPRAYQNTTTTPKQPRSQRLPDTRRSWTRSTPTPKGSRFTTPARRATSILTTHR